jgi:hypothetical protein
VISHPERAPTPRRSRSRASTRWRPTPARQPGCRRTWRGPWPSGPSACSPWRRGVVSGVFPSPHCSRPSWKLVGRGRVTAGFTAHSERSSDKPPPRPRATDDDAVHHGDAPARGDLGRGRADLVELGAAPAVDVPGVRRRPPHRRGGPLQPAGRLPGDRPVSGLQAALCVTKNVAGKVDHTMLAFDGQLLAHRCGCIGRPDVAPVWGTL